METGKSWEWGVMEICEVRHSVEYSYATTSLKLISVQEDVRRVQNLKEVFLYRVDQKGIMLHPVIVKAKDF